MKKNAFNFITWRHWPLLSTHSHLGSHDYSANNNLVKASVADTPKHGPPWVMPLNIACPCVPAYSHYLWQRRWHHLCDSSPVESAGENTAWADILIAGWWDPGAENPQLFPDSWPTETKIINVRCGKLLSVWCFVRQQYKTNTLGFKSPCCSKEQEVCALCVLIIWQV